MDVDSAHDSLLTPYEIQQFPATWIIDTASSQVPRTHAAPLNKTQDDWVGPKIPFILVYFCIVVIKHGPEAIWREKFIVYSLS